jgi:hypothetical protein
LCEIRGGDQVLRIRRRQRRYAPGELSADAERLAAGRKDARLAALAQHGVGKARTALYQMLAVVETISNCLLRR